MERPNIKIEFLRIENTPIPELSVDTLASLPIRHLILRNNTLSHFKVLSSSSTELSITSTLFDNVEQLEIQNNEVESIQDCPALTLFTNLQSLSLAGNKITEILDNTFAYFNSRKTLQQLDLSENLLSDTSINSKAFVGLEFLQKLFLDKNQLNKLPTKAIAKLSDSLQELFASANQIDSLEPGDIPPLPRLKSLGLDVNQIEKVDKFAFAGLPQLQSIDLSYNQLETFDSDTFRGTFLQSENTANVQILDLTGNPINCSPNGTDWIFSLKGKVRILGSCSGMGEQQQNMEGVELTKIGVVGDGKNIK
uniref:Uncharacterized protein n=1 Tax=Meloidogyne javanica TaxID=6303 RepID=A0A915NBP3_MELJA